MSEEKRRYVYVIDCVNYFVWLTDHERMILEDKYGIVLIPADEN